MSGLSCPECRADIIVSTKNGRPWYRCPECHWSYNADGDYEKHIHRDGKDWVQERPYGGNEHGRG